MDRLNDMNCIHVNKVNNMAEYNLLHAIVNPYKCTKIINSHYYDILHRCMNTHKSKSKFRNFLIFLDSGYSSRSLMRRIILEPKTKEDVAMKWHT